ncbi:MAG TPA: hypothetical protein VHZ03_44890 [Trebonia sp.]|nr:hypothetical protein [Trebonia sp.]
MLRWLRGLGHGIPATRREFAADDGDFRDVAPADVEEGSLAHVLAHQARGNSGP